MSEPRARRAAGWWRGAQPRAGTVISSGRRSSRMSSRRRRSPRKRFFGPVLAAIKARDFDHAIEIANNTEFGLTGGVYSKNKKKIEKAKREFFCGNLYLNRKCTGAMVGAHPFGGFNMSGTDSKAGGQDYLLLFLQAKSMAEKIK